jgi:transposase-like protein
VKTSGAPWTDEQIADVRARLAAGDTRVSIARAYGVDESQIRRLLARHSERRDTIPSAPGPFVAFPDMQPAHAVTTPPVSDFAALRRADQLRRQLAEEQARRKAAEHEADVAEKRSALVHHMLTAQTPGELPPVNPTGPRTKGRTRAIPVLLCSDWHVEETVDPATIHGANEYSLDIARERIERMFRGFAFLVGEWSHGWDVREAVVAVLGDLISGYIHDELVEGNSLSPTEAIIFAQQLLERGLRYLLEACPGLTRIVVPCCCGNHGRTTVKSRVATVTRNSFEWLMYRTLQERFAHESRLQFHVADGAMLYLPVAGQTLRLMHGDQVRYAGGVGGLSIPLRKAVDAWDSFRRADLTCLGHYHQLADYGFAVSNGSAIGYGPYAEFVKGRWESPKQAAFLLDEERGLSTGVARVYCDEHRRAA